ncbi:Basic leucine zipper 2 [Nymphaea thermarum]|nr:Basic leucine zipper 2 [Nymphaea thermarum]
MANFKGIGNGGMWSYSGRQQPHLPPKSPFPSVTPGFVDYGSSHATTSRGIPKPQEGQKHHQRTSSESCLIDELPSWLDDLLNEPETPVKRGGHRRSSSDSFAYLEVPSSFPDIDNVSQSESLSGNISSMALRGPLDFQRAKDDYHASFYSDANSFGVQTVNRRWNSTPNSIRPVSHKSAKNNAKSVSLASPSTQKDGPSATAEKQSVQDAAPHDQKGSLGKVEGSHAKQSSADVDQKRVKQYGYEYDVFANLGLAYVHDFQAEESEVSAELAFLDRQHLILSLENKALRQRLDSIGQEQLVKYRKYSCLGLVMYLQFL